MEEVGRAARYEGFADEFERHAEDGFHSAHHDRPACLELLGDVAGQHVLGTRPAVPACTPRSCRRGARVTGFDQSSAMVRLSRAGAPQGEFRVHDAADPPLPTGLRLGPLVTTVGCSLADPSATDGQRLAPGPWPHGTATGLPTGTRIHAVRGRDPSCLLAVARDAEVVAYVAVDLAGDGGPRC